MMDPLLMAIALLTAGAVAFAGLYVWQSVLVPRRVVAARITGNRDLGVRSVSALRKQQTRFPLVNRLAISPQGRERMQLDLERAGLRWRAQEFLGFRLASAMGFGLLGAFAGAGGGLVLALLLTLLGLYFGWLLPRAYLSRLKKKRYIQVEQQLPDALTAIAKAIRSGTGLMQALAFAADETPAPLGPELQSTLRDMQLGADPVDAFERLAQRIGHPDLDIAITAIIIQRTVGGNLSEILSNVTNTIRERAKIQREIRVLTARQVLMANLMAAMPVLTALLFIFLSPDIGRVLIDETVGRIALGFALAMEVAGIWTVRRLAVIEV